MSPEAQPLPTSPALEPEFIAPSALSAVSDLRAVDRLIGQEIDQRYLIEEFLGEGGTGIIYRARHTVLGKAVALKVLRPDVSGNKTAMLRFRQEALLAASIGDQHIVEVIDFGRMPDGAAYCAMEYLEGITLTTALKEAGRLPPERAIHIAKQLCRGLEAAHDIGIIHRDLKPDNIYLIHRAGDPDFVKILDFGIAKVGMRPTGLTQMGQVFGTPHYMSPEQCAGHPVDRRTDLYALGVLLYELVCGRPPFDAEDVLGVMSKHLREMPLSPRHLTPPVLVPRDLELIIMRCLEKQPARRYQTAGRILGDLEKISREVRAGGEERALEDWERTQSAVQLVVREPLAPPPSSLRSSLWKGMAALGLALALGTSAWAFQEGASKRRWQLDLSIESIAGIFSSAPIEIETQPSGAEVWQDGVLLGNTPFQLPRPRRVTELSLSKSGYAPRQVKIDARTLSKVSLSLEQHASQARLARPK